MPTKIQMIYWNKFAPTIFFRSTVIYVIVEHSEKIAKQRGWGKKKHNCIYKNVDKM